MTFLCPQETAVQNNLVQRFVKVEPPKYGLSRQEAVRTCSHGMLLYGSGLRCIHGCGPAYRASDEVIREAAPLGVTQ